MKRFVASRGTRGALGVFSLVLVGACAAQTNDTTLDACANPKSVACSHTGGVSSTGGTSGSSNSAGSTAIGGTNSGLSGSGGTSDPNAGAGTSSSVGGTSAAGGTSSSVGGTTAIGGTTASAGTGTGGTVATGGAGAGGTLASGGGGATGTAGTVAVGGAGGAPNAACTTPIPARTSWTGTASSFSNGCTGTDGTAGPLCNPPAYAFDASATTRFSTGKPQAGTEWLQIDLTTKGTVDQVVVSVSNGDFGRHLQIRMSDTDQDTAAAVLAEMDGVTGPMTFKFTPKTARFILISQTKPLATGETSWWSVQDVTATCN